MKFKVSLFISGILFVSNQLHAQCPTLAMSGTSVSCYGLTNGSAQVAISNGSGNYTITWSNGVTITTNPGLAVGTYTVNVQDNVSGCSAIGAYVVGSPNPISASGIVTNVNCFGNATGNVNLSVLGGTAPYTYNWRNSLAVTISTSQNLVNVFSGNYTVTITDFNGCTFIMAFSITQPAQALNNSFIQSNVSCFGGNNGAINVEVWGGTPSYTYSWSNSQSSQDVSNLTIGIYTLTITDTRGCQRFQTVNISQPTSSNTD